MPECLLSDSKAQEIEVRIANDEKETIVIDVVAQGEKGEKGDSAELTEEQMQEIKESVSDTLIGAIPEDELMRML